MHLLGGALVALGSLVRLLVRLAVGPSRSRRKVVPAHKVHRRAQGVLVVLCLLFVAAMVKLVDVQVVDPDRSVAAGLRQRMVSEVIPAGRGSLLDRNGEAVAMSIPRPTIYADPSMVEDPAAAARRLAPILGIDRAALEAKLAGEGRFVVLAHTVTDEVARAVEEADVVGIASFEEFDRVNPSGALARSVLGRVSVDGTVGISGLEKQWDPLLVGREGKVTYEGSRNGRIAVGEHEVTPARPGRDVQLTIDATLQYQTEQILAQHVGRTGSKGGTAIISDPATGEVLAMANVEVPQPDEGGETASDAAVDAAGPEVAAEQPPAGPQVSSNNVALTGVYEPGSVNKVITVAAALEEGLVEPDTRLDVPWFLQVADHQFSDAHEHPQMSWTVTDILAASSNVGTIKIAQLLGEERLDAYMRRFGLGRPTGLGFPNETAGLLLPVEDWSGTSLPSIAIGQGISVTATQMLDVFSIIANDGVLVEPTLVMGSRDASGRAHPADEPRSRRVISVETARQLRAMLAEVVRGGTGGSAAVPGYTVAGKTGTARKPQPNGGYEKPGGGYDYKVTFSGMIPAESPRLSIIVVLDDPATSIFASDTAAPAFSEVSRAALRRLDIPPSSVIGDGGSVPVVADSARDLGERSDGQGAPAPTPAPAAGAATTATDPSARTET